MNQIVALNIFYHLDEGACWQIYFANEMIDDLKI
jgi:hypothetical protein